MVVDAQTQTRGVDMGLFLRDAMGARDRVMLVSPHVQGKSEAWYAMIVSPVSLLVGGAPKWSRGNAP